MADQPFVGFGNMMTQSFEQTRTAMEKGADLNRKMQSYIEKNMAAANDFVRKLSQAKDVQSFWQIQTDFMQTQWKTFGEQMKDIGETVTKSVTGAFKDTAA